MAPKKQESARLEEVQEPDVRNGSVLVETVAVGVCGTDIEIVEGKYVNVGRTTGQAAAASATFQVGFDGAR